MSKQQQNKSASESNLKPDPKAIAAMDAAIAKAIRDTPARVDQEMALPPICEPGEGIYYDPNWKDCVADDMPE